MKGCRICAGTDRGMEPCPVCERPRVHHDPDCRWEGTLSAAAEGLTDAMQHLAHEVMWTMPAAIRGWWPHAEKRPTA